MANAEGVVPATNFEELVRPGKIASAYLLMLLHEQAAHGYELHKRLAFFCLPTWQLTRTYRTLCSLEDDGYVSSTWDTSPGRGPAQHIYQLTPLGEEAVTFCVAIMAKHHRALGRYLSNYNARTATAVQPDPAPLAPEPSAGIPPPSVPPVAKRKRFFKAH